MNGIKIREFCFNIFILLLFMSLTFFVGLHHEPWGDEAQSWLIARDASVYDIIFNIIKYEGTPPLWTLIEKFFIFCHLPYEKFFMISWSFASLGVGLFLFKSPFPKLIKILFPFTFFIFYQYCVVARSYCLILPIASLIAITYKKRFEKPFLYSTFIMLFASVSAHCFVVGFTLFAFFGFEIYQKYNNEKFKNTLIKFLPVIITYLYLTFLIVLLQKPVDCVFDAELSLSNLMLDNIFKIFASSYFNIDSGIIYFEIFLVLLFYALSAKICCINNMQKIFYSTVNFSLIFILAFLYCQQWHIGNIILIWLLTTWCLLGENDIKIPYKKNVLFYSLIVFLFGLQIFWSVKNSIADIKYDYYASKNIANFIKKNKWENIPIKAIGFHTVSIQPYFNKNIFYNTPNTYWNWDLDNRLLHYQKTEIHTPILIIDMQEMQSYPKYLLLQLNLQSYDTMYEYETNFWVKGEAKENSKMIIFINTKQLKEYKHE